MAILNSTGVWDKSLDFERETRKIARTDRDLAWNRDRTTISLIGDCDFGPSGFDWIVKKRVAEAGVEVAENRVNTLGL